MDFSKSMNRTITITIVILAVGAAPGFYLNRRLNSMRAETRALVEEADRLGLAADLPGTKTRFTKRTRADMERQSAATAGEVIALARKMDCETAEATPHAEYKSRSLEIMKSLAGLDAVPGRKCHRRRSRQR